jgi:hypothetical protein
VAGKRPLGYASAGERWSVREKVAEAAAAEVGSDGYDRLLPKHRSSSVQELLGERGRNQLGRCLPLSQSDSERHWLELIRARPRRKQIRAVVDRGHAAVGDEAAASRIGSDHQR